MEIAVTIRKAFEEGYASYKTAACSMTSFEEEWEESWAKVEYEKFLAMHENNA